MGLCDECKAKEAEVSFIEVVGGTKRVRQLCKECAQRLALAIPERKAPEVSEEKKQADAKMVVRCEGCGMSYGDFVKKGRLGCSNCFVAFESELQKVLSEVHGSAEYAGRRYSTDRTRSSLISAHRRLKRELQKAIEREEFEEAARIRDKLRKIEEKLK